MWIDGEVDVSRVALTVTVAVAVAAAPESATAVPCPPPRRDKPPPERTKEDTTAGGGRGLGSPRDVPSVRHGGSTVRSYGALWYGTKRWQSGHG